MTDPFSKLKEAQRQGWGLFAPLEAVTIIPAAELVSFAGVSPGAKLLDVATGTGVVALTAARAGAKVSGLDLSPKLLERARHNARVAGLEVDFIEGDAEALPYADASFDVVLSQYGHMFAPRPEVTISEMLRVLKPGGRIAFSTWPPEHLVGQTFDMISRYVPAPPGVPPTTLWGDPSVVRERLGARVTDLVFERGVLRVPTLSLSHYWEQLALSLAPVIKFLEISKDDPARQREFRAEYDAIIARYYDGNVVSQHYLMSRAGKKL